MVASSQGCGQEKKAAGADGSQAPSIQALGPRGAFPQLPFAAWQGQRGKGSHPTAWIIKGFTYNQQSLLY